LRKKGIDIIDYNIIDDIHKESKHCMFSISKTDWIIEKGFKITLSMVLQNERVNVN
jgi:hypothetical protein